MGDLKSQLAAIFPQPPECPKSRAFNSIAELYAAFQKELEGKMFSDPNGKTVTFIPEDFPHLVKLEFFDAKRKRWVDARAMHAIPQLRRGALDESRYRIGDSSRPRTLFWIPEIIANPDSIHPNKRNTRNDIYAKRYRRKGDGATLKIVLVETQPDGSRTVQTSFWSDDGYHAGCIHKGK
ncbi:MAG TPA: hypothetical protein VG267_20080 [Terracidiphilus sp.]|jgi:hypothetical protein|nr:hypothetical protein [Terracidiphilus sp.]